MGLRFLLALSALLLVLNGVAQIGNVVVSNVIVFGNHRTKTHVILRELPFQKGDTIDTLQLEELKKNAKQTLTNTSLFNFVRINHTFLDSNHILFDIKVQERWFFWPGIIFSLAETNLNSWWQNKDFNRINYGLFLQDVNFRGRREILTLHFQYGWKRQFGMNYQIPGINKKRTIGAGFEAYYANNREINYASADNERLFFRAPEFIQEEFRFGSKIEVRRRLFNRHRFGLGLNMVILSDTVLDYNRQYLPDNRLRSQYLYLNYGFRREKRDNVGYPLAGYLIDLSIDQEGLGLIRKGDIMVSEAFMTFNWHSKLGGRWYYATGLKGKTTFLNGDELPYYYQRGLGYSNAFIRGYELIVIDGQHFGLYKSNLKYNLVKKRSLDVGLPGWDRFDKFHYSLFLNLFADAGYVVDNINASTNPLANSWQYAAGLGLDFVTYYDIVIRFEGAINKQGRPGFYIHFTNPI